MSQLKVNSIIPVAGVPTGGGGGIIQIKQTIKKNVFSTAIGSNTNSGDTGLNVSITPTSTSSKILISAQVCGSLSGQDTMGLNLFNGSSLITDAQGDADGNRGRAAVIGMSESAGGMAQVLSLLYLHSPASTSEQTYGIRILYFSGAQTTMYINRVQSDDNAQYRPRSSSFITAMEVSA
jgi:hypothetical protein